MLLNFLCMNKCLINFYVDIVCEFILFCWCWIIYFKIICGMKLKIICIYLKIIYFDLKLINYIIIENEMLMYFLIFLKVFILFF